MHTPKLVSIISEVIRSYDVGYWLFVTQPDRGLTPRNETWKQKRITSSLMQINRQITQKTPCNMVPYSTVLDKTWFNLAGPPKNVSALHCRKSGVDGICNKPYLLTHFFFSFCFHFSEEVSPDISCKALSKFEADDILELIVLFFRQNKISHFIWIFC